MASPTSSGVELIEHQIDPSASGISTFEAAWQGLRDRMGERAGLKPRVADTLGRSPAQLVPGLTKLDRLLSTGLPAGGAPPDDSPDRATRAFRDTPLPS